MFNISEAVCRAVDNASCSVGSFDSRTSECWFYFFFFKRVLVDDVFVLLPGAVLFSLAGAPSLTESEQRRPRGVEINTLLLRESVCLVAKILKSKCYLDITI